MGIYSFKFDASRVKELLEGLKFDEQCLRHMLLVGVERNVASDLSSLKPGFRGGRRPLTPEHREPREAEPLTNEALQKKIEEIST